MTSPHLRSGYTPRVIVQRFVNGRTRSNAYVFSPDPSDRRCLIVDAGVGAAAKIAELVRASGLRPEAVLLTHGHPDHIWTARELSDVYEVPVYVHALDLGWFSDPATGGNIPLVRLAGRAFARRRRLRPPRLHVIDGAGSVDGAGVSVEVIHTPGHTAGSVCFRAGAVCFAGDTVFRGALGHTAYPGGNRRTLRESILAKLLPLPDDLRLLPGHGGETTVRAERRLWERVAGGD